MIDLILLAMLAAKPPPLPPPKPTDDRRDASAGFLGRGSSAGPIVPNNRRKPIVRTITIMRPIGYYVGPHPDAIILDRITEQFGSRLEALTRDDKAAVLICLVEAAINPQQIFIQENFFTNQNGGEVWNFAQRLSADQQLALAVTIAQQLASGEQG